LRNEIKRVEERDPFLAEELREKLFNAKENAELEAVKRREIDLN